jgi:GDP-4-dehydro-6-deoxy-D-mannose reductase
MKVLVTGSQGFVGKHLVPRLASLGHTVIATDRAPAAQWQLDLPDDEATEALFEATSPDVVVHLAAVSAIPASEEGPTYAFQVNVDGTRSLAKALLKRPDCRLIFISSAAIYGEVAPTQQPIREECGANPRNVYGWTKLAGEALLHATLAHNPAQYTILRAFNHSGPGQQRGFALADFASQIVELERGGGKALLKTGDLNVTRDFLDVRDVVEAYVAVLETPQLSGTLNVCSGSGRKLSELVHTLCELADVSIELELEPKRMRSNDMRSVVGDAGLLRAATGWSPRIAIATTLADLLSSWRDRVPHDLPS